MNYYIEVIKNYAVFTGRSRRAEYWMFILFNFLIAFILGIIDFVLEMQGILGGLYMLALLIPGIAVAIRRLHDIDKSGWWILISLIPLIGSIVLLVFMVTDSTPGANQYGLNPKELPDEHTDQVE